MQWNSSIRKQSISPTQLTNHDKMTHAYNFAKYMHQNKLQIKLKPKLLSKSRISNKHGVKAQTSTNQNSSCNIQDHNDKHLTR